MAVLLPISAIFLSGGFVQNPPKDPSIKFTLAYSYKDQELCPSGYRGYTFAQIEYYDVDRVTSLYNNFNIYYNNPPKNYIPHLSYVHLDRMDSTDNCLSQNNIGPKYMTFISKMITSSNFVCKEGKLKRLVQRANAYRDIVDFSTPQSSYLVYPTFQFPLLIKTTYRSQVQTVRKNYLWGKYDVYIIDLIPVLVSSYDSGIESMEEFNKRGYDRLRIELAFSPALGFLWSRRYDDGKLVGEFKFESVGESWFQTKEYSIIYQDSSLNEPRINYHIPMRLTENVQRILGREMSVTKD